MANLLATFIGSGALPDWAFAHGLPSVAEERVASADGQPVSDR